MALQKTQEPILDYNKIDQCIEDIIERVATYMVGVSRSTIADAIHRAYMYARDAHE